MLYWFNGLMNSKLTITILSLIVIGFVVLLTLFLIVKLFRVIFSKNKTIDNLSNTIVDDYNEELNWNEEVVDVPVTVYKKVRVKVRN